ncbi:MAG: 6-phosphogluconolactonase [Sphingobium sp.]|nr:6-phosphogluconolactonase [Sphingobium sp.]
MNKPRNAPQLHEYGRADDMARDVATFVADVIHAAIADRGRAVLALPGGRSPVAVFEALARVDAGEADIDWGKVTLFPADDRIVAEDSPLSNVALLRRHFGGTGAQIITLVDSVSEDRTAVAASAEARLSALNWPLDLVWLGMGTDGHTASIFPGPDYDAALADTGPRAVSVLPDPLPPEAPVARITLTRGAIITAKHILLTLSGNEKREVLDRALAEGSASTFPVGRVLSSAHNTPHIYWSQS